MYQVSNAYKDAMHLAVQSSSMHGTVDGVNWTEKNILSGSCSLTNQCSDGSNVQIGQVYIAEFDITLMGLNIPRYSLPDKIIQPVYSQQLINRSYEDVPLGVFNISSADWTASGIVIKAYDNMSKLDKSCGIKQSQGTPYQLAKMAMDECKLELGTTADEFSTFANGTIVLSMYTDNDIDTWRDFISWVAQACACNVFAGRDGKIYFRAYNKDVVETVNTEHRFTGCSFSDFETRYTGISCVNIGDQTTSYYGTENDDALTYNLGQNPFLQYGLSETLEQLRRNILFALQMVDYVPFKASMIGNPVFDLMDVFSFSGGIGDADKLFCMTKFDWKFHGSYDMEGSGQNPALANAKSKVDKNIAGLLQKQDENTMHYSMFQNAEDIAVGDGEYKSIMLLRFVVQKMTHVTIQLELNAEVETTETGEADPAWEEHDAECRVVYFLNGEEVTTYYPKECWFDGHHLLHLQYDLEAAAQKVHTWDIWMKMKGGSIHFAPYQIKGLVTGEGLVSDTEWNGAISAEEKISRIDFDEYMREFTDSGSAQLVDLDKGSAEESISRIDAFSMMMRGFTDSVNATSDVFTFTPTVNKDYSTATAAVVNNVWTGSGTIKEGTAPMVQSTVNVHGTKSITTVSSNAVYYFSFDSGANWYGYTETDGWTADKAMIQSEVEAVPESAWAEHETVIMKVLLEDGASLSSVNFNGGYITT